MKTDKNLPPVVVVRVGIVILVFSKEKKYNITTM